MTKQQPFRSINTYSCAIYVLTNHTTGYLSVAFVDTVGNQHCAANQTDDSYMDVGLGLVTKIVQARVKQHARNPYPLDFELCTNQPNLAKAVTRAFILGRQWHQQGIDPTKELKRRGKDTTMWMPLVKAVADLYAVAHGVHQKGYVGKNALSQPVYIKARQLMKDSRFTLPNAIWGPHGSK